MNKPHVHAELIKAWADGAEIEYFDLSRQVWAVLAKPAWGAASTYRIKPERVFPESTLTVDQLLTTFYNEYRPRSADVFDGLANQNMRRVANAAIKQYILDTEAQKGDKK